MINNTSISSPTTPVVNSTIADLGHSQVTTQPIAQVTNTQETMETIPSYAYPNELPTSVVAGLTAFGAGLGMISVAATGVGIPVVLAAGVGYGAFTTTTVKIVDKIGYKLSTKSDQAKTEAAIKLKEKQD